METTHPFVPTPMDLCDIQLDGFNTEFTVADNGQWNLIFTSNEIHLPSKSINYTKQSNDPVEFFG